MVRSLALKIRLFLCSSAILRRSIAADSFVSTRRSSLYISFPHVNYNFFSLKRERFVYAVAIVIDARVSVMVT